MGIMAPGGRFYIPKTISTRIAGTKSSVMIKPCPICSPPEDGTLTVFKRFTGTGLAGATIYIKGARGRVKSNIGRVPGA